jgi:CRP/FNR family transcriptional regulator
MDEAIEKKIVEFFQQYKFQTFKKGEILIRADDDPAGIFYIQKGTIRQYVISKKGDELVVNIFKPPSFFPMSWAVNQTPNLYYFEAMTDVEAYRVPKDDAIRFLRENPDVLYDLLKRVYKGTDGLLTRMTYLMAGSAYGRLITELILHAGRFGVKRGSAVVLQLSEMEIAAQSGMTRETVSREIKLLKEKRIVVFEKGHLVIQSMEMLEEELLGGV